MLLYDAQGAPNPRRVRIFLAEKGIDVPKQAMAIMDGAHKAPDFIAKYPPGQLPVLEFDDGSMIGESVAICRYFEELHPEPALFGITPRAVAEIDMWTRRIEFGMGSALRQVWVHTHPLTARVVKQRFPEFGESNRPLVVAAMMATDTALGDGRPFMAGATFSMADIVLLTTIDFARFVGVPVPGEATALAAWHARVSSRPSATA